MGRWLSESMVTARVALIALEEISPGSRRLGEEPRLTDVTFQGWKSLASRVQCVCARAVQNWCSSLLLGLLFSRFYTDHPVPHFSLFTRFKNIDATTLFYFQSSVDQIYTLYPSFTQEDFLSLKMAYLYHWPLVSTVIFSDFSLFIFWQQGGAGVVSCYCQPVLISVNKRNVSQPLFEVSGCCSFEKCEN